MAHSRGADRHAGPHAKLWSKKRSNKVQIARLKNTCLLWQVQGALLLCVTEKLLQRCPQKMRLKWQNREIVNRFLLVNCKITTYKKTYDVIYVKYTVWTFQKQYNFNCSCSMWCQCDKFKTKNMSYDWSYDCWYFTTVWTQCPFKWTIYFLLSLISGCIKDGKNTLLYFSQPWNTI